MTERSIPVSASAAVKLVALQGQVEQAQLRLQVAFDMLAAQLGIPDGARLARITPEAVVVEVAE